MIRVEKISKNFWVPHEKNWTVREKIFEFWRRKNLEKFTALREISLEIRAGDFFGIVGKNGSGKSTLLKIIAGILAPDRGKIFCRGRVAPFLELGIGFNPELTARENIFLNGILLGISRKKLEKIFNEILQFAELENFADQKIKNFSSGMTVRLAFSIAIRADAEIFLFDEILAVGDANFQKKCFAIFEKFKSERRTILFVSHSPELIEKFCNRAAVLDGGRKIFCGDPKIALQKYFEIL